MISIGALISLLVYLIVCGVIFYLLWWLIGYCGLPEPFNKVARIILAVVAVLVIINVLLMFIGRPFVVF